MGTTLTNKQELRRIYYQNNKEKFLENSRRQQESGYSRDYYYKNQEILVKRQSNYNKSNRLEINERKKQRYEISTNLLNKAITSKHFTELIKIYSNEIVEGSKQNLEKAKNKRATPIIDLITKNDLIHLVKTNSNIDTKNKTKNQLCEILINL